MDNHKKPCLRSRLLRPACALIASFTVLSACAFSTEDEITSPPVTSPVFPEEVEQATVSTKDIEYT